MIPKMKGQENAPFVPMGKYGGVQIPLRDMLAHFYRLEMKQ
jgi:hypothetical protein